MYYKEYVSVLCSGEHSVRHKRNKVVPPPGKQIEMSDFTPSSLWMAHLLQGKIRC